MQLTYERAVDIQKVGIDVLASEKSTQEEKLLEN